MSPLLFCLKALWDELLQCADLSLLTPLDLTQPMEVFTLQLEPPETTLAVHQEEVWAVCVGRLLKHLPPPPIPLLPLP